MGKFIEGSRIDEEEYVEFSVYSPEEFINMLNNNDDFMKVPTENNTEDADLRAYEEFR
ncbi:hypothetical protein [Salinicoccus halitifaciens]|uniref:Uncharacterized protein n=1 Tax=Salinicoccus halitifaciens TaxID=1073415 RepID=A0ABV2E7X4_9STAP|nr:hypothetical protein [Salinicoccus halitifaciens]MCD2136448.1 hypothetical protein [Salinicoccus halitifaciens]